MNAPHTEPAPSDIALLSQTQALLWASEVRFCHQARAAAFSAALEPANLDSVRAIEGLLAGRRALATTPERAATWLATLRELDRAATRKSPASALSAALLAHAPSSSRGPAFNLESVPTSWLAGDSASCAHASELIAAQHIYGKARRSDELDPALDLPLLAGLPKNDGPRRPLDAFWTGILVALFRAKWWLDYASGVGAALERFYTRAARELLLDLSHRGSNRAKDAFCEAWELGGWTSSVSEARLMLDRLLAAFEGLESCTREENLTAHELRDVLSETLKITMTLALPENALRALPPDPPEEADALRTRTTRIEQKLFELSLRLRIWRAKIEASAHERNALQDAVTASEDALRATGRVLLLQGNYPASSDFANALVAAWDHPGSANANMLMDQIAAFEEHVARQLSATTR